MAILIQDSFNRADSSTGLGTADTGQAWSVLSGIWGIQSNRAYWVNGNPSVIAIDSGQSDVQISLDSIVTGTNPLSGGIGFRVSDANNYWFFRNNAGTNQLYKVVGGTASLVSSIAYALATGTYVFKVVANGSTIECYVNDVLQLTVTDTHNQTSTKHGLRNHTTTTTRFDNFLVESLGNAPTGTDGSTAFDLKQTLFQDASTANDSKQVIYNDSAITNDTKQAIYQDSTITFDTIQQLFENGTMGAISFDLLIKLYQDSNNQIDTKQTVYSDSVTVFDTLQEIFNSGVVGSTPFDLRVVLYNDNKADNDVIQSFYQDGLIDFDTMIKITEGDPIFAVIRLKGKQVLDVKLIGQQQSGIHLKGLIQ